jgi:hypothetical protein
MFARIMVLVCAVICNACGGSEGRAEVWLGVAQTEPHVHWIGFFCDKTSGTSYVATVTACNYAAAPTRVHCTAWAAMHGGGSRHRPLPLLCVAFVLHVCVCKLMPPVHVHVLTRSARARVKTETHPLGDPFEKAQAHSAVMGAPSTARSGSLSRTPLQRTAASTSSHDPQTLGTFGTQLPTTAATAAAKSPIAVRRKWFDHAVVPLFFLMPSSCSSTRRIPSPVGFFSSPLCESLQAC